MKSQITTATQLTHMGICNKFILHFDIDVVNHGFLQIVILIGIAAPLLHEAVNAPGLYY